MISIEEQIFEHNFVFYLESNRIISKVNSQNYLNFLDNEEFEELLKTDIPKASEVYTKELLYKTYFLCISGLIRNFKWMEGIVSGYSLENIFIVATSIRGLIESCSDIFYSTKHISKTLFRDYSIFLNSLQSKSEKLIRYEDIEKELNHYLYAHKVTRGQNTPNYLKAKTAKEYLIEFQQFESNIGNRIEELYNYLCQFSHPSAFSIMYLNESEINLCINIANEKKYIDQLILEFQNVADYLLQNSINPIFLLLKFMNYLPLKEISIDIVKEINLNKLKLWRDFENMINTKNKQCLIN